MTFSTAGNCHPLLVASVYDHYLDLRPTIHPLARVCISPCCKLSLVYKGTKLGRAVENEAVSQSDSEHAHLVPGGTRTGDQHTSPPNFEARAFWRNSFAFTPWVNKCLKYEIHQRRVLTQFCRSMRRIILQSRFGLALDKLWDIKKRSKKCDVSVIPCRLILTSCWPRTITRVRPRNQPPWLITTPPN